MSSFKKWREQLIQSRDEKAKTITVMSMRKVRE